MVAAENFPYSKRIHHFWTENNERILQVVQLHHRRRRRRRRICGCHCWVGVAMGVGVKQFAYILLCLYVHCTTAYNDFCMYCIQFIHSSLRLFDFSHSIRHSAFTSRPVVILTLFKRFAACLFTIHFLCWLDNWNIAASTILSVYILR